MRVPKFVHAAQKGLTEFTATTWSDGRDLGDRAYTLHREDASEKLGLILDNVWQHRPTVAVPLRLPAE